MSTHVAPSETTWDIFIAYPADTIQDALALYELLTPHLHVFLDKRSMIQGSDFDTAIPNAQRNARMTVVLVGKQFGNAYYARAEAATAVALARTNPKLHAVIPVYLEGMPPLHEAPYGLQLKHAFDLHRDGGWAAIAKRLVEIVSSTDAAGGARSFTQSSVAESRAARDRERELVLQVVPKLAPWQMLCRSF